MRQTAYQQTTPGQGPKGTGAPLRVLLIDDDEEDFILTRELLSETEAFGRVEMEWVDNYVEGLRSLTSGTWDVCLLDYYLGAHDGLELLAAARAAGCRVPTILLTGAGNRSLDQAAIDSGAADYLVKAEISAALLERSIRHARDRARAQEAASFLAEAGIRLTSSLDYQRTLESVAQLAAEVLCDYCLIDLVDEEGELKRLELASRDPGNQAVAEKLRGVMLLDSPASTAARVLATQRSVLVPDVDVDAILDTLDRDDPRRDIIEEVGPVSLMATPLIARGRFLGLILFVSADSGRRYDERDLALAEQLAVRAALATDNARLYQDAREAVETRDRVQHIVAHDLRNPLTTIKMVADLLERDAPSAADPELLRKHLAAQKQAIEQMNWLIEDLLDVARIEEGQLSLNLTSCSPAILVDHGIELYQMQAQEKSIELVADAASNLPAILVDADRIDQVFSNLIGNALKFTDPGGRIEVGAAAFDGGVTFSVSDTGCGIPPEQVSHLFDRFWQAQRGARHGAGLGLSIAKGIIQAHGGQIWVESELGEGTTFFFFLPHQ